MTFTEWWKDKAFEMMARPDYAAEDIARDAWEIAQRQSKYEIDALMKERNEWRERCDTIAKKSLETAHPKWIDVKQRLPDLEGVYLWLRADKSITIDHYWTQIQIPMIPNVIAWMPLPEYKEQEK